MDRRRFVKRSAAAGAGLVIAAHLPDRLMARAADPGLCTSITCCRQGNPGKPPNLYAGVGVTQGEV
jgi:hypothetical protein